MRTCESSSSGVWRQASNSTKTSWTSDWKRSPSWVTESRRKGCAWTQLKYRQSVRCSHRPTSMNSQIHGHGELPGAVHASPAPCNRYTTCSRMTCPTYGPRHNKRPSMQSRWCCSCVLQLGQGTRPGERFEWLGLGSVLLQDGKPVAYASQPLFSAERRYPQIENEMLSVLFGLSKFHHYTHGQDVTVVTDHKPLVAIRAKPLGKAPKRLQHTLCPKHPHTTRSRMR